MRYFDPKDSVGGWFIGNFPKTVLTTDQFEVSYKTFKKGEKSDGHIHTKSTEYNLVVSGLVLINNSDVVGEGFGFIYEKNEPSVVEFLQDSALVVIRVPSVNDKEYPTARYSLRQHGTGEFDGLDESKSGA